MNELIHIQKTQIGAENVNSVNSRDIYNYLEVKTAYSNWIKRAIEKYDFIEGEDFVVSKNGIGSNAFIDYIVSIDMAKELCMVSNTEKGKETRKYFIEAEKRSLVPALPQTYIEALEALTASEKEKLALTNKIAEKDKVILAVADLNIKAGDVSIGDFSKNLAIEGLGQNNLFSWLKARGFLMMNTAPYQQYVERGYFVRKPNGTHNGEVRYRTMLTPKGTIWLTKMLKAEFDLD
jgi:anti-repressor protein